MESRRGRLPRGGKRVGGGGGRDSPGQGATPPQCLRMMVFAVPRAPYMQTHAISMTVSVPLRATCRLVSIKHSGKEGSQTGAIDRKSWNLGETLQWVGSKSVCLSPFGHHGLGGYNSRHLFLTGLKAGTPRIKAPADSAPASLVRRWSSAGGVLTRQEGRGCSLGSPS